MFQIRKRRKSKFNKLEEAMEGQSNESEHKDSEVFEGTEGNTKV